MRRFGRRPLLAAAVCLLAGAAGLVVSTPAQAEPREVPAAGTFTVSGEAGEPLTGGNSYAYSTGAGNEMRLSGHDQEITVRVFGGWNLILVSGPDRPLAPGTYTDALGYPWPGPNPGLTLVGPTGPCDESLGSFTITDVVFAPYGYMEKLDASFEVYCDGASVPARGEVHLTNPPAPPLLDPRATVADTAVIAPKDGTTTVHGTLTCRQAATLSIYGAVTQGRVRIWFEAIGVQCAPDQAVEWTATTAPVDGPRLRPGDAEVTARVEGRDPFYDEHVQVDSGPTTVRLMPA
ncbi:hypothetical protein ABZV78_14060 [Micromonospora sp. NPDC004540]|uniref:hypothetical protein n=1 Tax=Micromonospora sp. NPDC004540 TaxID=3154457 RepID=UPI0033AEA10E